MKTTKQQNNKGFTLIELLVTIAIIGTLSAVVLASVNTARAKAGDAAVKSGMKNAQTEAESFYNSSFSYAGVCATTGADTIGAMVNTAAVSGGGTVGVCNASSIQYAASARLKKENQISGSSGVDYWCIDSSGTSKILDTDLVAQTQCP